MVITTPRGNGGMRTSAAITPSCVRGKPQVGDTISNVTAPTSWPAPPPPKTTRNWLATGLAGLAAVLAAAALVVAFTRTATEPQRQGATSPEVASYTASETAEAQRQLCDTYKLGARAVRTDSNGTDAALSRTSSINAAAMLDDAITSRPALDGAHREAAAELAAAYRKATAVGAVAGGDDPDWRAVVDEVNAKDAAMKAVCGG